MKKPGINIIIVERSRLIIHPEPAVLMTKKAILRIAGTKLCSMQGE
jgi:hypothetical protein